MKPLLFALTILLALPSAIFGADGLSLSVTNTRTANQRRYITVDVCVGETVPLTKDHTLLVVVGQTKGGGPADEFGPPQNFALKGTSHEVGSKHFRVDVALPPEKVRVKFMLVDKKKVLYAWFS
jgi:hypothetical protein